MLLFWSPGSISAMRPYVTVASSAPHSAHLMHQEIQASGSGGRCQPGAYSASVGGDVLVPSGRRLAKQRFGRPSLPVLFEDECLVPTRRHPQGGPLQAPVSHL